jgi:xanthosine utilization system XapX-like protein
MGNWFDKQNAKKTLVAAGVLGGLIYSMRAKKGLAFTAVAAVGLGIVGGLIGNAVVKS